MSTSTVGMKQPSLLQSVHPGMLWSHSSGFLKLQKVRKAEALYNNKSLSLLRHYK